jgi:hypothetical protein
MKDSGEADVILNIKMIKNESGITLFQSHYVEKVLSRFGFMDSKPSPTPCDNNVTVKNIKRIARDQLRYCQIIGSLMYLASATRPDISFVVRVGSCLTWMMIIGMHLKGSCMVLKIP